MPPAFSVKDLALNGRDLISMGLPPGPAIGEVLETLLREVQDETLPNEPEALRSRAAQLLPTA